LETIKNTKLKIIILEKEKTAEVFYHKELGA